MGEGCPDKQELQGRLIEILHRISGADPAVITPDARLMEDVGIDSLGFYEILIEADTNFGIRIKEEELLRFRTVADILQHLESLSTNLPMAPRAEPTAVVGWGSLNPLGVDADSTWNAGSRSQRDSGP